MALKIQPNSSKSSTGPTDENTSLTSRPIRQKNRVTSQRHRILFRSNLEDNAERWYSKLPAATKGNWEALRTAFTVAFQMDEVDNEARIVELRLELADLKQRETENITEFIARADVLAKELSDSQVDVGIAVTQGILDLEHKEKLLFECARSKNNTFSSVKTFIKALYFSRGKDSPFDPAYNESRSVGLPSPIQSTEELLRQYIPLLVQGVQTLNSTLIHGPSSSSHPTYQQPYNLPQAGRQS